MYQLLIVDDESSVVDSLALTIPWEEHGFDEVHRAYSADEALQIAAKHAVDVMITDIRMPEIDGLELIERVKRFSRKIRCIILSGHDEFEYAQKAIQYQTINYLLKPVNVEELVKSVGTAIQDIEREWAEISSNQRIKQTLHANKPLLRNQLLNDLLQNKPISEDVLDERLAMLDITLRSSDPFVMMVIRLEVEFYEYDLHSLSLLEYAVGNIAEEVYGESFNLWHCTTDQGYLVFLVKCTDMQSPDLIDSYAIKLQQHVQKYLKCSISVCLSGIRKFPRSLADLYHASVMAFTRNVGGNRSYFITIDEVTEKIPNQNLVTLFEPPLLPALLESGSWQESIAKIGRILSINTPNDERSHDQLFTILLYLSSSFSLSFSVKDGTLEEQLGEEFDLMLRKKSLLSSQRIYEWAKRIIGGLKDKASGQIEDSHQLIASKVRSFIQGHLAEGIALQTVAEHVGLHPVYLSKVYKTVTGETIGDYLYRTRMERAAHLLRTTDLKINEISGQLGFLAPPHFIKIFKRQYGSTPQEFRNK
ncbi:response regulator transcription factor [Paenibacillus sp. YIM B09110]|uniref:response regulator transcription factor n=1 Tax=Paenibacillus sp. YIM B09110 TaxID=3126102 RepID=UPI00301D620D